MSSHVLSVRLHLAVFAALMAFTAVTLGVAFVDLGWANDVAALGIATAKATLVALYFMHVRFEGRLTGLVIGAGLLWLLILIGLTLADYLTRGLGTTIP